MFHCEFFSPVKLAIWEASLDKFVESIQSIPEVIIPVLLVFKDWFLFGKHTDFPLCLGVQ